VQHGLPLIWGLHQCPLLIPRAAHNTQAGVDGFQGIQLLAPEGRTEASTLTLWAVLVLTRAVHIQHSFAKAEQHERRLYWCSSRLLFSLAPYTMQPI